MLERLPADGAIVSPLIAFLPLEDVFSFAIASQDCRKLCRNGISLVNLRALSCDPERALQYLAASSLTEHGASIHEINASFCMSLSGQGFKGLPKLGCLQSLNLDGCQSIDDAGLIVVAQCCPNLRRFSLYWNVRVTDKGVCRILRAQQSNALRDLNLSGCKHITDDTVQRVVSKAPKLEILDITRCPGISEAGVLMICESLSSLQVLRLYAMAQLDPSAFTALHRLTGLIELDLCGCRIEDAQVVRHVQVAAPSQLRILNLTWCPALTDHAVHAIAQSCPFVEWLSIFGNLNITGRAIEALSASPCARTLHSLDVRGLTQAMEYSQDTAKVKGLFPAVSCFDLHH